MTKRIWLLGGLILVLVGLLVLGRWVMSREENAVILLSRDEALDAVGISPEHFEPKAVSVFIDKSGYRLTLRYQGADVKTYPVVFGGDPLKDKRREGDQRTPEGMFRVRDLYPHQKWQYFIWLNYPTEASWRKHRAAKVSGNIPQRATIGGEIGIHGTPSDLLIDTRYNWTLGCVSVKQADVAEIYPLLSVGTPVEIVP